VRDVLVVFFMVQTSAATGRKARHHQPQSAPLRP
jgi:hypothetical protein